MSEAHRHRRLSLAVATLAAVIACSEAPAADSVRDFYSGKVIHFIVPTSAGGGYDLLSRVIAQHMGKHLPGNPAMVVENMPAGGGIAAANYVGQVAPRDGTVLSIVIQGMPVAQALGTAPQFTADLRNFNWIANVVFSNPVLAVWHTSPTKTLADAMHRETTIGANGAGSVMEEFPLFYNNVLGTKFKLVSGYPGGPEIDLAMERGEVEGRGSNTYASYMQAHPDWIPNKVIIPLIQIGIEKDPGLPDTPLLLDVPVKSEFKPYVEFMSNAATVGRPLATTPGAPPDRVAALRQAFDDTVKDPEFIADVNQQKLDIQPLSGDSVDKLMHDLIGAPKDVRDHVQALTSRQ
jgi:tripartite-type tricarboxylate transporter receptor subunit TctC